MSKDTISVADDVFVGKGRDRALENLLGRRGAPFSPKILASLGTPAVADADYLIKAATSIALPNNETVTYTAEDDADAAPLDAAATVTTIYPFGSTTPVSVWSVKDGATYGRNIACAKSAGAIAMTMVISGYDYLKRAMTESFTIGTGTTAGATGKKAFAYVSSIAITSAGNAEANTFNVGTGSVLGLPYKLAKIGHLTFASIGGVQELIGVASNATVVAAVTTAASETTGDVRGTITFNGTLNGTSEAIVEMYSADRNSAAGLVGVTQA
jgi:hypothetical protein